MSLPAVALLGNSALESSLWVYNKSVFYPGNQQLKKKNASDKSSQGPGVCFCPPLYLKEVCAALLSCHHEQYVGESRCSLCFK